jgi:hypothetical protein
VCTAAQLQDVTLSLEQGVRSDELTWSISGQSLDDDVDVLSELNWDEVAIYQVGMNGGGTISAISWLDSDLYFAGSVALGVIYSGEVTDSDYAGDDRSLEWSRSVSDAGAGESFDISVEVGPILHLGDRPLKIIPVAGFSLNYLGLVLRDGDQVLSENGIRQRYFGMDALLPVAVGPITDLDSCFDAYWYGPFLGLRLNASVTPQFSLTTALNYHLSFYYAEADWNLRQDLDHPVSFTQDAVGGGVSLGLQAFYRLGEHWSLELKAVARYWSLFSGYDRTYLSSGDTTTTDLNDISWRTQSLSAGLNYRF